MLKFYLSLEAHDEEKDCHYLIDRIFSADDYHLNQAQLNFFIHQFKCEIAAAYKRDLIKDKKHLKVVK